MADVIAFALFFALLVYAYVQRHNAKAAERAAERYCRFWCAAVARERAWAELAARQTGTIAAMAAQRRKLFEAGRN